MSFALRKRLLQIAVATGSLVPILAGLAGATAGTAMLTETSPLLISLDSHFRYLSGLLFAIGLGYWTTIPHIETKTTLFRTLTAIVFVGGLGRLYGVLTVATPDTPMLAALGMELIVTPLLCLWQRSVARKALSV